VMAARGGDITRHRGQARQARPGGRDRAVPRPVAGTGIGKGPAGGCAGP
jgi:hypothetical protein